MSIVGVIAVASATTIQTSAALMSSGRTFEGSGTGWGFVRLGLGGPRLVGAVACFCLGALLGLLEPLVRLVFGTLAVLALLVSGFYALAVPFKAFPVFGLLGTALVLILLTGLLRALRNALTH